MFFVIAILSAFLVTFVLLPVVIKVTKSIKLLDLPDRRKVHLEGTPSMGGIAIFLGFMMAILITLPATDLVSNKYLFSAVSLIFFLGIRDDISSLIAHQKLITQVFAAVLVVFLADIRLTGFYDVAGIGALPFGLDYILSICVIVTMTNSFNLIDGIDGLAASLGIIILLFFSWILYTVNATDLALISFAVSGSLLAFLIYNWHPSRIFMGDTGSMILGFLISTLAIKVINVSDGLAISTLIDIQSSVALVIACLIVPFYDTLRVFTIRFIQGRSPFSPDRNHIHHSFLKLGLNHAQATQILALYNITMIAMALLLNSTFNNSVLLVLLFGVTFGFGTLVDHLVSKRRMLGATAKLEAAKTMAISKSA